MQWQSICNGTPRIGRMTLNGLCAATLGVLGGCASQPDRITAQEVSTLPYRELDCAQLGIEMDRVSRRVGTLHASLKRTADNDAAQFAVGMLLFWPTLFFLEGGDKAEAAEFARLKGEYEALHAVADGRGCDSGQYTALNAYRPAARVAGDDAPSGVPAPDANRMPGLGEGSEPHGTAAP
jgi:hypothetical protein